MRHFRQCFLIPGQILQMLPMSHNGLQYIGTAHSMHHGSYRIVIGFMAINFDHPFHYPDQSVWSFFLIRSHVLPGFLVLQRFLVQDQYSRRFMVLDQNYRQTIFCILVLRGGPLHWINFGWKEKVDLQSFVLEGHPTLHICTSKAS